MTTCPSDFSRCEQTQVHVAGTDIVGQKCEKCQGIWLDRRYLESMGAEQARKLDQGKPLPKIRVANKICPRCRYLLQPSTSISDDRSLGAQECFNCGLLWLPPGTLRVAYKAPERQTYSEQGGVKRKLQFYSTSYLAIFSVMLGMSLWQKGTLSASADSLFTNQLSSANMVSVALWLLAFFIFFSTPLSIYLQIVMQEKHLSVAIKHPLTYILPTLAILVALINIAVFAPAL